MVIQGRMTRFAWAPNLVIGIEKLAVPPSTFGLTLPEPGTSMAERVLPTAVLFQIEEMMGQRIERNLGTPALQGYGWSMDQKMCYPSIWLTPEEAARRDL